MATICTHLIDSNVNLPSQYSLIYKDECTACFDNDKCGNGIDVCLSCFNGGCSNDLMNHSNTHFIKTKHLLSLNIKKNLKTSDENEPAAKITKLEISEQDDEKMEKKYETIVRIKCHECGLLDESIQLPDKVEKSKSLVLSSLSANKKSQVQSWAPSITDCEHMSKIEFKSAESIEKNNKMCFSCEKTENLWMCLECGNVGCGRKQYDGSGGNNHAISHYEQTGHKASVKLGTIEPNGKADVYCYICDENRTDPFLSGHLKNLGIILEDQTKTEKGMSELELEQNLKFDFSMVSEDGKDLKPVCGKGLTGISNLGNSCYMSSVLQCVFSIPAFIERYTKGYEYHNLSCNTLLPASCLTCQLYKLCDGLNSGHYASVPGGFNRLGLSVYGIKPRMFKDVIGKDSDLFSQMGQQDAGEFFTYMLKSIDHSENILNNSSNNPTSVFDFYVEEKLQCTSCMNVSYSKQISSLVSLPLKSNNLDPGSETLSVTLEECFDKYSENELIEGYNCPTCKSPQSVLKSTKFASFPKILAVHLKRYEFVNWVPTKI
ncbi:hypothetical protein BB560_003991, partial [Smittium megazygosporum]